MVLLMYHDFKYQKNINQFDKTVLNPAYCIPAETKYFKLAQFLVFAQKIPNSMGPLTDR